MKLLLPHVDETLARHRLLGPRRNPPMVASEPGAQAEAAGRRGGFQAAGPNAGDGRDAFRDEPPR